MIVPGFQRGNYKMKDGPGMPNRPVILLSRRVRNKGKGDQEAIMCGTESPREKRCLREGVLNIFTRGLLESLAEYQHFHV